MVNPEQAISCPIYPLADFQACRADALDDIISGLQQDQSGCFERGTITADGRLDMCKQAMGPGGTQRVLDALHARQDITTILFGTDGLGDGGAKSVADFVSRAAHIETVYLGCNGISAAGMEHLGASLESHPGLRGLWLKRNPLREDGARILGAHLAKGSRLEVLDLVHTGIGLQGFNAVAEGIIAGKVPLTHLFIGGNAFTEDIIPLLCDLLAACPSLQHVYAQANFIGNAGARRFADSTVMAKLTSIGIGSNNIHDEAMVELVTASGKHLEILDLGRAASERALQAQGNSMDDQSCTCLVQELRRRPALRFLNVSSCKLSSQACEQTIELLLHHRNLNAIRLTGNDLSRRQKHLLRTYEVNHANQGPHHLIKKIKSVYR